jgi:hypothetical protein
MKQIVRSVFIALVLVLLLGCLGFAAPADFLFAVFLGWAFYLVRVVPQSRVNPGGLATALVCLAGFALGLHWFLRWVAGQARKLRQDRSVKLDRDPDSPSDEGWRVHWTAAAVTIIVLMFVSGIAAAGLVHQVGWLITAQTPFLDGLGGASMAVRRAQSTNNLKQIGLAANGFHDRHGRYPAGCTADKEGEILHGWAASLLPYLERQSLHDRIDFARPWDAPSNQPVFREQVFPFLNPAVSDDAQRDRDGYWMIHYAGNVHVLGGSRPRTRAEIKDGTAQTIMAGEIADRFPSWGKPGNWRDPALGINRTPGGFGSPFPGGANLIFLDGSVRFAKNSIDPKLLRALGTPDDGGPMISEDAY